MKDSNKVEASRGPITLEQYKMWATLKNEREEKVDLPLVQEDDSLDGKPSCPHCGSNYMHHLGVEIFNRKEDSETGDHITIYTPESFGWNHKKIICPENTVDGDMRSNPSERRTGISISFACEECDQIFKMEIAQHKGLTLISWRF